MPGIVGRQRRLALVVQAVELMVPIAPQGLEAAAVGDARDPGRHPRIAAEAAGLLVAAGGLPHVALALKADGIDAESWARVPAWVRDGDAAAMAPIDYTRLVFAILFGLVLFHEVPNLVTMIGALIVIGSTLVITLRELHFRQKQPPVRTE